MTRDVYAEITNRIVEQLEKVLSQILRDYRIIAEF